MRRFPRAIAVLVGVAAALALAPAAPGHAAAIVRNPGLPRYRTELSTGGQGRVWRGSHRIAFSNLDAVPLDTVYLRLWSNGVLGCAAGSIRISNPVGGTIGATTQRCTAVEITLEAPLAPGDRTSISMDLRIEVPNVNDRFGYHRGLALLGTALPTLAVHDDAGWHLDPFVDLGESFYSITGSYRVTLETPDSLDTPTTGLLVDHHAAGAGRESRTYAACDVRDFAWAAGRLRTLTARSGDTHVVVSYQADAVTAKRAAVRLRDAVVSMDAYSRAFGAFPYREMDVVLAGHGTFGGMEYPTVIFTNPARLTVSHELAHQGWYGIVGNDQHHEPWLDESFASWAAREPLGPARGCSGVSWPSAGSAITNDMSYWATHPSRYWVVYEGGACMLANLSKRFGHDRFLRTVGRYVGRHHLDIARTGDFMAAFEAAADRHLDGFDAAAFWGRWRVADD